MHSEGIAAVYLPGEGTINSVCLALSLTKRCTLVGLRETESSYVPGRAVW